MAKKILGIDGKWLLVGAAALFLFSRARASNGGGEGFGSGGSGGFGGFDLGNLLGGTAVSGNGGGDVAGSTTPSFDARAQAASIADQQQQFQALKDQLQKIGISDPYNAIQTGGGISFVNGVARFASGGFVGLNNGAIIPASFSSNNLTPTQQAFLNAANANASGGNGMQNLTTCNPSVASCI